MVPHAKYQKLSVGQQVAPHTANQLQNYKISPPPPGLPLTDVRVQQGAEIERQKVELKRDKNLEQELGEISDTESDNSESTSDDSGKDWISVWKSLK